jgi:hypothetical protein
MTQLLGLGDGLIPEVRVSRLDHARDAIDLVAATAGALGLIEHTVLEFMRLIARCLARATAGLAIVLFGAAAGAQDPTQPEADRLRELECKVEEQQRAIDELKQEQTAKNADTHTEWSWVEGFQVTGKLNGADYVLRPVAALQLDYRAFPHEKPADQFLVRRADVGFVGQFGDFGFMARVAPSRPGIPLSDAWLQWQTFEALRIRVGHIYAPFTIDNGYQQEFRADLVEAPMALGSGNVISPDYRPGGKLLGSLSDGLFKYWLALTNTLDTSSPHRVTHGHEPDRVQRAGSRPRRRRIVGPATQGSDELPGAHPGAVRVLRAGQSTFAAGSSARASISTSIADRSGSAAATSGQSSDATGSSRVERMVRRSSPRART